MTQPLTPDSPTESEPTAAASTSLNANRRKLGLTLGAGVLSTLASRPVLALCTSASAAASGNLSQHGPVLSCDLCLGIPGWILRLTDINANLNVQFHSLSSFGVGTMINLTLPIVGGSPTLLQILLAAQAGTGLGTLLPNLTANVQLLAEFCVAYLNITQLICIPTDVLSLQKLEHIWSEFAATGAYEPKAGTTWNQAMLLTYLRTLHP